MVRLRWRLRARVCHLKKRSDNGQGIGSDNYWNSWDNPGNRLGDTCDVPKQRQAVTEM
jgi:hypothetical protein